MDAGVIDFVADATDFLVQVQKSWRPSASTRIREHGDIQKLSVSMFGPPPSAKSSAFHRPALSTKQNAESKLKNTKPANRQTDPFGEWNVGADLLADNGNSAQGIEQWCKLSSTRAAESKSLKGSAYRSCCSPARCSAISSVDEYDSHAMSTYLNEIKSRKRTESDGAASSTTVKLKHGNPKVLPPDGNQSNSFTPLTKRSSAYSSAMSSGYNPLLSTNKTLSPHIPCRNNQTFHKHKSYSDLQECSNQSRTFNVRRKDVMSHAHSHRKTQSATESNVKMDITSDKGENSDEKSEVDDENEAITAILNENLPSSEDDDKQKQDEQETGDTQQDFSSSAVHPDDITPEFATYMKPQTMQEYVEKFYMPPTKISIATRQLPVIAEKSQKLVESILNYRHVLGSREKSENHKSRYLSLSAPDIRKATVQLLKTSVQRAAMRSKNMDSDALLRQATMTPSQQTDTTRSKVIVPVRKPTVIQDSIPDIGVTWKVTRSDL